MKAEPAGPDAEAVVYLDHAATSPLRAVALDAMLPWLTGAFGNPSGAHSVARKAKRAIEDARDEIAEFVGRHPLEIVFTSGGTEADNHIVAAAARRGGGIVVSAIEHHAVLEPAHRLAASVIPVTAAGTVDPESIQDLVAADTSLVSVMAANNETGAIQPLAEIARAVRKRAPKAWLHTDAVQAAAWLDLRDVAALVDALSLSAHKLGGPQGVGALVVPRAERVEALLQGGGQEREMRSGTHNVAGIVGFAAAARESAAQRDEVAVRVGALRDRLEAKVLADNADVRPTMGGGHRLPNNLHLCFAGVESEALVFLLDRDGVCASAASACSSGGAVISHVLAAMGVDPAWSRGAVRLTLGRETTEADVDRAAVALASAVARLRSSGGAL